MPDHDAYIAGVPGTSDHFWNGYGHSFPILFRIRRKS
jgi:hypothetical protein